jgi:hypothetical protein
VNHQVDFEEGNGLDGAVVGDKALNSLLFEHALGQLGVEPGRRPAEGSNLHEVHVRAPTHVGTSINPRGPPTTAIVTESRKLRRQAYNAPADCDTDLLWDLWFCCNFRIPMEAFMRVLTNVLVILAALGMLIGLVLRLKGGLPTDPVFFWRGSMALLTIAITVLLIQIRNK